VAAPCRGAPGDAVQCGDDSLVGPVGGGGEVPRAAVGVPAEHVGQPPVRGPALRAGRRPVHRRAHQRVVKGEHVAVDAQQSGPLGLVEGGVADLEPLGGGAHHVSRAVSSAAATSRNRCADSARNS
jgi:hypothetical protein